MRKEDWIGGGISNQHASTLRLPRESKKKERIYHGNCPRLPDLYSNCSDRSFDGARPNQLERNWVASFGELIRRVILCSARRRDQGEALSHWPGKGRTGPEAPVFDIDGVLYHVIHRTIQALGAHRRQAQLISVAPNETDRRWGF